MTAATAPTHTLPDPLHPHPHHPFCSAGGPWFAAIPEELWPDVDVS